MAHTVLKLGGTALGTVDNIQQIGRMLDSHPEYAIIVPSAPAFGKKRVTELLRSLRDSPDRSSIYWELEEWYLGLSRDLALSADYQDWIRSELMALSAYIDEAGARCNWSYVESRGEYWIGHALALWRGLPFVDPKDVIKFTRSGKFNLRATRRACKAYGLPERFVMAGFYGSDSRGNIHTFPRNGSDISAAIIAVETHAAALHIGRKGVRGICVMNPNLFDGQGGIKIIPFLGHEHAREMTYRGEPVLHPLALVPVAIARIPVRVFDIDAPEKEGTYILPSGDPRLPKRPCVLGIAERAGFTVFALKRFGLNEGSDFSKHITAVLDEYGTGYEHQVTGVDHVTIVISNDAVKSRQEEMASSFRKACRISVSYHIDEASICIVGHDLGRNPVLMGDVLIALGTSQIGERACPDIRIGFESQGSAGTSHLIGVPNACMHTAVNRLYRYLFLQRK